MLDVSVIIVSWNVRNYLADCLRSVFVEFQNAKLKGDVWVVDNHSTDGTPDMVQNLFPHVNLIANTDNPGFGAANNQGMRAADANQPRYFFLLNPDTLVRPGGIGKLIEFLDHNQKAGMCGSRLVYGDGRFQHSAFMFPKINQLIFDLYPMPHRLYETRLNGRYPRRLYHPSGAPFLVDHPLGASMMVRRDIANATGGFDERFFMYCEELDWCMRIHQAGWQIYTVPEAEIVHYGGESTKQVRARSVIDLWTSRAQFYKTHYAGMMYRVARRIVRNGMLRKAKNERSPEIKAAYQQVIEIWE